MEVVIVIWCLHGRRK